MTVMTADKPTTAYQIDRFGFSHVTSMTGRTDPESRFAGAELTMRRVHAPSLQPGMLMAVLAAWHDNGVPQPANVIGVREVTAVDVQVRHGRHPRSLTWGRTGARVIVDFADGDWVEIADTEDFPAYVWEVSGL